jgi:hypothetical protein
MGTDQNIDQLLHTVQRLDRRTCIAQLRQFRQPKLDFTDEFLDALSLDRLRHIVMAACIQAKRSGAPR